MIGFVLAAVAGAVFALGLAISGMTIPAKVTGFLDVGGAWDPTLGFVMAGAIAVYAPLLRIIRGRGHPILADGFHWPTARAIDARLIGGAAIFGIGWGLSGYCPGPALASLTSGMSVVVFVVAMLVGIVLARGAAMSSRRRDEKQW